MKHVNGALVLEDEEAAAITAAGFSSEGAPAFEFPVGYVWISTVNTNPATPLGYGTWAALGAGRMPVFYDANDSDFNASKKTGGAKTHTLTSAEMPSHTHIQDAHAHGQQYRNTGTAGTAGTQGASTANNATVGTTASVAATNQATGGGGAHNNMPPFITLFGFERTA
jgi:hypothetical protein